MSSAKADTAGSVGESEILFPGHHTAAVADTGDCWRREPIMATTAVAENEEERPTSIKARAKAATPPAVVFQPPPPPPPLSLSQKLHAQRQEATCTPVEQLAANNGTRVQFDGSASVCRPQQRRPPASGPAAAAPSSYASFASCSGAFCGGGFSGAIALFGSDRTNAQQQQQQQQRLQEQTPRHDVRRPNSNTTPTSTAAAIATVGNGKRGRTIHRPLPTRVGGTTNTGKAPHADSAQSLPTAYPSLNTTTTTTATNHVVSSRPTIGSKRGGSGGRQARAAAPVTSHIVGYQFTSTIPGGGGSGDSGSGSPLFRALGTTGGGTGSSSLGLGGVENANNNNNNSNNTADTREGMVYDGYSQSSVKYHRGEGSAPRYSCEAISQFSALDLDGESVGCLTPQNLMPPPMPLTRGPNQQQQQQQQNSSAFPSSSAAAAATAAAVAWGTTPPPSQRQQTGSGNGSARLSQLMAAQPRPFCLQPSFGGTPARGGGGGGGGGAVGGGQCLLGAFNSGFSGSLGAVDSEAAAALGDGSQQQQQQHPFSHLGARETLAEASQADSEFSNFLTRRILTDYRELRELGRGCFGRVALYEDTRSGARVAVKVSADERRGRRERAVLTYLGAQPHVVRLSAAWEEGRQAFLEMEFCAGGSVAAAAEARRRARRRWAEAEVLELLLHAAIGLDACHRMGVAHVDVKPDNILRDAAGNYKLTDFGCSVVLGGDGRPVPLPTAGASPGAVSPSRLGLAGHTNRMGAAAAAGVVRAADENTQASVMSLEEGDCRYLCADMLNEKRYCMAGDVFSLGMSLYELMSGAALPKNGDAFLALRRQLPAADLRAAGYSETLVQLVCAMTREDPTRRPTARCLLQHVRPAPRLAALLARPATLAAWTSAAAAAAAEPGASRPLPRPCQHDTETPGVAPARPLMVPPPPASALLPAGKAADVETTGSDPSHCQRQQQQQQQQWRLWGVGEERDGDENGKTSASETTSRNNHNTEGADGAQVGMTYQEFRYLAAATEAASWLLSTTIADDAAALAELSADVGGAPGEHNDTEGDTGGGSSMDSLPPSFPPRPAAPSQAAAGGAPGATCTPISTPFY